MCIRDRIKKAHKLIHVIPNNISMVIFDDEYIEKEKVGIIIITATIFDLRLMLLCSFQSRINRPKSL